MKPLNRAERNNAFLNFLLLFFITIGVVITVVFFSIKVPFRENEQLRKRVLIMQNEKNLSDSFRVAMDVALNEFAKYDSKDPVDLTKRKVQLQIERMSRLIKYKPDEKSGEEKSIYDLVIQNMADLNAAKTRIRILEDQKATIQ